MNEPNFFFNYYYASSLEFIIFCKARPKKKKNKGVIFVAYLKNSKAGSCKL